MQTNNFWVKITSKKNGKTPNFRLLENQNVLWIMIYDIICMQTKHLKLAQTIQGNYMNVENNFRVILTGVEIFIDVAIFKKLDFNYKMYTHENNNRNIEYHVELS